MAVENQVVIDKLTQEIYEMAGEEFNINSPKQLGVILFEKMGLPLEYTKKTKTGYSTAVDVLERLAPIAPIVAKILEYRQITKLQSTYVLGLQDYILEDGKIHTRYVQDLTHQWIPTCKISPFAWSKVVSFVRPLSHRLRMQCF